MRKFIASVAAFISLMAFAAAPMALAGFEAPSGGNPTDTIVTNCAGNDSPLCTGVKQGGNQLWGANGILTKVAGIFAILTGIISVFMIVIGGIRYVTSGGDSGKTKTAKDTIMYAAIGLAVASVAGVVLSFVISKL